MAKITGAQKHRATLRRIRGPAAKREYGKAIHAAADMLAVEAAISITAGAVGGAQHVPSSPGQAPNADTGVLDRSIVAEKTGDLTAIAAANAPYAAALEFGTSKMDPRPFMAPAAEKIRPKARKLVEAARKRILAGDTL